MKRKITVIHPSRSRPEKAFSSFSGILDFADCNFQYILSIDKDDPQFDRYIQLFNKQTKDIVINENSDGCVSAVNKCLDKVENEIIIVFSDDFDQMPIGWDSEILLAVDGRKNFLLKTSEGNDCWIATLPIMDRHYIDQFGYIYFPEYKHLFCDTDLTSVAEMMDCIIVRNDIIFKQNRINDGLNVINNNGWCEGEAIYIKRLKNNFGLDPYLYKYNPSSKAHENWIINTISKYK